MDWAEICQNPYLRNLPFKIQSDKWGNIVMSPASNEHGIYQANIVRLIGQLNSAGIVISECSVQTTEGIKVADVAFATPDFLKRNKGDNPYREAPEVCVEIISPSNTLQEMDEKKALYFAQGAREVWLCASDGNVRFYRSSGGIEASEIVKGFPNRIELYWI
jgi:Uma2 family endonuclease